MGRFIRWQAIIAFSGIALIGAFLFSIAISRTTILVPDEGGVYVEGLAGTPQHINPLLAQYNQVDQDLASLIFNGLTRRDSQDEPRPDLAEKWAVSPDGITYLFWIRQDVRWSDGERFDADDVIFTISLIQDPDFPGVPFLGDLWRTVTVEKIDDFTVRFRLSEPFPAFLDYTTIGILPEHVLSSVPTRELDTHPFNAHPIGTGPFMLTDIDVKHAVLVPNPRSFEGEQPYLDGIEFRFYPTHERLLTAYQNDETMGISYVQPHLFPQAAEMETLNLYSARLSGYQIVYLNLQDSENSPFFQDVNVRQALIYGLDRQSLIDDALNGQGLVADSPVRSWMWAFAPEVPGHGYDQGHARDLLDEAGWIDSDGDGIRDKDGLPLKFTLLTGDDPSFTELARAMAEQWKSLGIRADVETLGAGLSDRLRAHHFQAVLIELLLSGDPDPYPMWDQTQIENGQNYGGWDNTQASEALEQARFLTDPEERKIFYTEFQHIFAEEVPALIIAHPVYTYGVDESVKMVQIGPLIIPSDRFDNIADWYMNTRRVIVTEAERQTTGE